MIDFELIELTDRGDIAGTYDVYKYCMFAPTEEKFIKKVQAFMAYDSIRVFACLYRTAIKGVIVISFLDRYNAEIVGIAVDRDSRDLGIGSYMIQKIIDVFALNSMSAETDKETVGFYQKNGFEITESASVFDNETVIRYKCRFTPGRAL